MDRARPCRILICAHSVRMLCVTHCLFSAASAPCLQGFVGWWMVRSGLHEPDNEHNVPRVSPYRLATHLTSAFVIYATLVWTTLDLAHPKVHEVKAKYGLGEAALRRRLLPLCVLLGVTAVSGPYRMRFVCT